MGAQQQPNPQHVPFLCVIIPAYNEEKRIPSTLERVAAYLQTQDYSWEVLVVDDGSSDSTASLVSGFAASHPGVSLLSIAHAGKGWAVRSGMLHTRAQHRFICDADLSMPIEQLERFLPPRLSDYHVALGSREAPGARRFNEPRRRHIMGRVYNTLTRLFAVPGVSDTQCGFKCFTGPAADKLFAMQHTPGFAFDVEILFLARRLGLRLVEVPIDWHYSSESKVRPLRDGLSMMLDILKIRWAFFRGRYRATKS